MQRLQGFDERRRILDCMSMAKLLILVHEYDRFQFRPWGIGRYTSGYLLFDVLAKLRERRHEIVVSNGIPERQVAAEAVFMHVDATVLPEEYVEFAKRYPVGINTHVKDISKQKISSAILRRGDHWDGPVIVKSNLNSSGNPERRLNRRAAAKGAKPPFPDARAKDDYEVFDKTEAVPEAIFDDPWLAVEKFLPEREIDGYAIRFWTFCGNQERCTRYVAADESLKAKNFIRSEPVPVPDSLREIRSALRFDYGKFDFVVHDGKAILLDANKTMDRSPRLEQIFVRETARFAMGVESLLAR